MIDKNEAPDGYEAVKPEAACRGCAFKDGYEYLCGEIPDCLSRLRNDGEEVIFVRKSTAPATLLHPMGSMGEEV